MLERERPGRLAVVLTIVLGVAALGLSQVGDSRLWLHSYGGLHLWYHLGLFAAFGLLAMMASPRPTVRVWWLVVAVLVGVAIEYGEVLRFHTDMEWYDVRTDLAGLAMGAVVGWLMMRRVGGV